MSEETNVETTPQAEAAQEGQNVNISVDQILAAVLSTVGSVNVKIETLIFNYSTKTIKVDQLEDQSVTFELIDLPELPAEAEQDAPEQISE